MLYERSERKTKRLARVIGIRPISNSEVPVFLAMIRVYYYEGKKSPANDHR